MILLNCRYSNQPLIWQNHVRIGLDKLIVAILLSLRPKIFKSSNKKKWIKKEEKKIKMHGPTFFLTMKKQPPKNMSQKYMEQTKLT